MGVAAGPENGGLLRRTVRVALLLLCLWGLNVPRPLLSQADPVTLLAAGDIANCDQGRPESTAALLDNLSGTIATLGDTTYPDGAPAEFADCFASSWGRHKARIRPIPGNREYSTPGAAGYFGYFGPAATPQEPGCTSDCKGYYAYDLGAWRLYALNSEASMSAGSEQEQWLRADLAAHPASCILAYRHHPLFSSGRNGSSAKSAAIWQALYAAGADVVLVGHHHLYERFAPQAPDGRADPYHGIRQFTVGTGGVPLHKAGDAAVNSEVVRDDTWGILKLTLYPTRYTWEFVPIAGQAFTDSGQDSCIGVKAGMSQHLYLPLVTDAAGQKGPE